MMMGRVINAPSVNYTRWTLLRLPWFSIYLHNIKESDKEFHNHKWNFLSIILKGECAELNIDKDGHFRFDVRIRKFLNFRYHNANDYHYLRIRKPVWSICICGKPYNRTSTYRVKKRPRSSK